MVDIYGSYFEYGGELSREYGLILANMDTARNLRLSGEINGVTVFNKKNARSYLVDQDYRNSPVSFDVEFFTYDQSPLQMKTMRQIEKWLFQRRRFQKLYIAGDSDFMAEASEIIDGVEKRLYLNCRFSNPERIEHDGGIVGFKATLEADNGFWWQDPVIKQFDATNDNLYTVTVDTDIDAYTYPKITIRTVTSSPTLTICNLTDDEGRVMLIDQITAGKELVINSELNYISTRTSFTSVMDQNFPRLLDGENQISITGDEVESVTIEFQNRRML